jgi:glycogen(starch) synthase
MNVAFYSPTYPEVSGDGGIGTYTRHLARCLCELGHKVHVLTSGDSDAEVSDGSVLIHLVRDGYFPIVDRLVPGLGACYRICTAMRRLVRQHRIDVVEFPNWEGLGLGYALQRVTPVVVRLSTSSFEAATIDGPQEAPMLRRRLRWDIRRERWLTKSANMLITHSIAHRERMSEEVGIAPERFHVVPLGIPTFPDFRRLRHLSQEPTLVFLGRLEKRKGTLDLIHSVPHVLRAVPDARFLLIGADRPHCPGGRTHAQFVRDEFPEAVGDRIRFLGRLPDEEVDCHLQSAELFISPSLYESFGLTFLEAMRWGTPVIGTTAGAIPEIIEHGETGLLVKPGSPLELAEAIITLLKNDDLRHKLGEAGRRRVETFFTVERQARQTAELYEQVVEAKACLVR